MVERVSAVCAPLPYGYRKPLRFFFFFFLCVSFRLLRYYRCRCNLTQRIATPSSRESRGDGRENATACTYGRRPCSWRRQTKQYAREIGSDLGHGRPCPAAVCMNTQLCVRAYAYSVLIYTLYTRSTAYETGVSLPPCLPRRRNRRV